MDTQFGTFELCPRAHVALRMFMHSLACQLHYVTNKNTELSSHYTVY